MDRLLPVITMGRQCFTLSNKGVDTFICGSCGGAAVSMYLAHRASILFYQACKIRDVLAPDLLVDRHCSPVGDTYSYPAEFFEPCQIIERHCHLLF